MHHLFSCMSENSLLGQVELRACAIFLENLRLFFTHAWSPQCVFFRDGKFLLEAGGILRLCKFSLKMRLDIVLLRTHGIRCVFAFVLENACLRQVEF